MNETAWAAGLFEGEGCVSVGRHGTGAFATEVGRATVNVTLSTTDLDVLEHFMAVVGCGFINERKQLDILEAKRERRRRQGVENFRSSPHDEMVRDDVTGRFVGRVAA